ADRTTDGKDIGPLLSGQAGARTPHEAVFFYAGARLEGGRSGKWKLYLAGRRPAPKKEPAPLQLYEPGADLGEPADRSAPPPEVVKRLQALAERCREDLGDGARPGKNTRPPGEVGEAKPLTQADARGGGRGPLPAAVRPRPTGEVLGNAPSRAATGPRLVPVRARVDPRPEASPREADQEPQGGPPRPAPRA